MTIDNRRQWDYDTYHNFPVKITRYELLDRGPVFESHWHEQFQILYYEQGEALINCNRHPYEVKTGDLVVINNNEIHFGETLCEHLIYYITRVD